MSYSYHAKRRISIISSETNFSFLASYLTDLTDLAISLYYFPIPFNSYSNSIQVGLGVRTPGPNLPRVYRDLSPSYFPSSHLLPFFFSSHF